eukprot:Amastigsp_a175336_22.p3 type:complete len:153 gc:universal Amastigsp_a175336_22:1714-1256(-)
MPAYVASGIATLESSSESALGRTTNVITSGLSNAAPLSKGRSVTSALRRMTSVLSICVVIRGATVSSSVAAPSTTTRLMVSVAQNARSPSASLVESESTIGAPAVTAKRGRVALAPGMGSAPTDETTSVELAATDAGHEERHPPAVPLQTTE